jgi:hypothetical protein
VPDDAGGPSSLDLRPASSRNQWNSVHMMTLREGRGVFGARPSACVPNSSPSQVQFKESTPMSPSCDLFYESP